MSLKEKFEAKGVAYSKIYQSLSEGLFDEVMQNLASLDAGNEKEMLRGLALFKQQEYAAALSIFNSLASSIYEKEAGLYGEMCDDILGYSHTRILNV